MTMSSSKQWKLLESIEIDGNFDKNWIDYKRIMFYELFCG